MRTYIKEHLFGAGKWIYRGYKSAWEQKGFNAEYYTELAEIDGDEYILMTVDSDIDLYNLKYVEKAQKAFVYVQPNSFPSPWGTHPNFQCLCDDETIQHLNSMENVFLWSFGKVTDFHNKWKDVYEIPLAFDSVNYKNEKRESCGYDVCFVGGWANNGFNEKKKIMLEHLSPFMESNLKCGFFVGKDISHEQENLMLYNSKVAINIHDAYQKIYGLDTNERTFKSLGLTGCLISDEVECLKSLFPDLPLANSPQKMLEMVLEYVYKPSSILEEMKESNRLLIEKEHTYISRVNKLLEL